MNPIKYAANALDELGRTCDEIGRNVGPLLWAVIRLILRAWPITVLAVLVTVGLSGPLGPLFAILLAASLWVLMVVLCREPRQ